MEIIKGNEILRRVLNKEGFKMLFIGVLLIADIAVMSLLDRNNGEKVMNDYCKLECKQNIQNKHKFCC